MNVVTLQVLWRFPVEPVDANGHPAKGAAPTKVRCIAVAPDGIFHVVSMPASAHGETDVSSEVSFSLTEGLILAEAVLSGRQQALTQPGAMRIVAATAKIFGGMLIEPEAGAAMVAHAGEAPA